MAFLPKRKLVEPLSGVETPAFGRLFGSGEPSRPGTGLRWGAVPWLLLAAGIAAPGVLLLHSARSGEGVTLDAFRDELRKRAGDRASDCGEIHLPFRGTPVTRNECLNQALASGTAFRAAFAWDGFGHGYDTWFGYARGADGRVWRVTYSADQYAGYRERAVPMINVHSCPGFVMPETFSGAFFC